MYVSLSEVNRSKLIGIKQKQLIHWKLVVKTACKKLFNGLSVYLFVYLSIQLALTNMAAF